MAKLRSLARVRSAVKRDVDAQRLRPALVRPPPRWAQCLPVRIPSPEALTGEPDAAPPPVHAIAPDPILPILQHGPAHLGQRQPVVVAPQQRRSTPGKPARVPLERGVTQVPRI